MCRKVVKMVWSVPIQPAPSFPNANILYCVAHLLELINQYWHLVADYGSYVIQSSSVPHCPFSVLGPCPAYRTTLSPVYAPLGHNGFSESSGFWWLGQFWGALVRCFVGCSSAGTRRSCGVQRGALGGRASREELFSSHCSKPTVAGMSYHHGCWPWPPGSGTVCQPSPPGSDSFSLPLAGSHRVTPSQTWELESSAVPVPFCPRNFL